MSKNSYSKVGGENVRLLQALIDEAPSYTKPTNSRNANILKSIINNTEYNEPPQSEIEELLIALKAKIGGEIEVNELTVIENGSYDAGLNKAYNPVNVEVPLDSKEITANGTYNASEDNLAGFSQVTVNVEGYKLKDIPNTTTAIATFTDGANLPMPKLEVAIEPQQDLHGYDSQWVGGSGKNKLKDDLYYDRTLNGVTFARQADGGIKITGTATQNFRLNYSSTVALKTGQYILSGGATKVEVALQGFGYVTTNEISITVESDATYEAWLYLYSGTAYNTTIYPMLRPSNTDSTFAPYSNICPIIGWDEVNVTVADDTTDPTTENVYTLDLDGTRYGGKVDLVSGAMTVDRVMKEVTSISSMGQSSDGLWYCTSNISDNPSVDGSNLISDYFMIGYGTVGCCYITGNGLILVFILPQDITTPADATSWCETNKPHFVYELATPLTIQLPTAAVKSLRGVNNISADSGDVLGGKYFSEL